MKALLLPLIVAFALLLTSCSDKQEENSLSESVNKQMMDSLSKVSQKARADSLKNLNPLLILPPDSEYSGQYIDRYKNGIVKFRGTFRFGERHGQWFSFYPNGLMWSEMHYDKGLRHGPNNAFFENGKPRYTGYYRNDLVDSVWTYYDSTGKTLKVLTYKNNRLINSRDIK